MKAKRKFALHGSRLKNSVSRSLTTNGFEKEKKSFKNRNSGGIPTVPDHVFSSLKIAFPLLSLLRLKDFPARRTIIADNQRNFKVNSRRTVEEEKGKWLHESENRMSESSSSSFWNLRDECFAGGVG